MDKMSGNCTQRRGLCGQRQLMVCAEELRRAISQQAIGALQPVKCQAQYNNNDHSPYRKGGRRLKEKIAVQRSEFVGNVLSVEEVLGDAQQTAVILCVDRDNNFEYWNGLLAMNVAFWDLEKILGQAALGVEMTDGPQPL